MSDDFRVLHVDDEPDFADVTAEFLERHNDRFQIKTVMSAAEGLDTLDQSDIDCIVSDHDMPGMNGIEFLEHVRAEHPDLPFILFTGKGTEAVASRAISAGVTDYLQKEGGSDQFTVLANRIEKAVAKYQTEQELDETRRQYQKVIEQNLTGSYLIQDGEFVYVNQTLADIHGYDRGTVIGMSPLELVAPEERDRVQKNLGQRLGGDVEEVQYETVGLTKDGDRLDIELHGSRVTYEGRSAVIGTELDITERKEQERVLEKEREFIEQSLDTLDDIFYFVDTDGDFERWNSRLPELTGYSDDEISSMNALEFFEGEHREAIQTSIRTIFERGSHVTEAEITTADGRAIPHEFRGVRMTDDDGNPTGIIGIARNITERKQREERLIRQNNRLEEFVEVVSHDLRNPLNVAESRLSLAAEECDSEHITRAADAISRSQALIRDLLRLAREDEEVAEVEPLELADVARDSWETVDTGSAELELDTTQGINANRSRLQQVFENLYRNAVEHGGEGVTVSVGDIESGFYVGDSGPGIPEADHDEIFDAGYSTAEGGTGFGLRIVKQIAEAHGWAVTVTEGDQGGAQFEVTGINIVD